MRKKYTLKYNSGFTLIELLVVLAIFMVVAGLTIFDYGSFRSSTSMQNLADDIALSIRKAQSYAIGAYGSSSGFSYGYGVHFSMAQPSVPINQKGSTKSFIIFTDINGDKIYDTNNSGNCGQPVTASNECSELLSITSADQISAIYLNDDTTSVNSGSFVDVVFMRPNPDAYFCFKATSDSTPPCDRSTDISHVRIEVSPSAVASGGKKLVKTITIWNTGQISVQ